MKFGGALSIAAVITLPCFGQNTQQELEEKIAALSPEERAALDEVLAGIQKRDRSLPSGWHVNALPIVSYNSDLGFQIGATADIYDYGKRPTLFPDYLHRFHVESSYYTGGQSTVHLDYDSDRLIPGVRFSAALTYQANSLYKFYGFGGDIVTYDRSRDCRNGQAYYTYGRQMVRLLTAFQGRLADNLNWVGGVSLWHVNTAETSHRKYDGTQTLYHFYRQTGVIGDDEVSGTVVEFKAGLNYDTRDFEPAPSRGISADLYLNASPDLSGKGFGYAKLSAHFRHYITPGPDWLTLAYHLAYQGVIGGRAPFFVQQNIYSLVLRQCYNEGLGGLNTIRGVMAGRLVGNGYAWANFEARFRLFGFQWLGIEWVASANPFYDVGAIVQPYKISEIALATGRSEASLRELSSHVHQSAGIGFKLALDRNYILSLEIAKAFRENDGPLGVVCTMNYIF